MKEERGNVQNVLCVKQIKLVSFFANSTHVLNSLSRVQHLTIHHRMQMQYRLRYRGSSERGGGIGRNMRRIQHIVRVCSQYTES